MYRGIVGLASLLFYDIAYQYLQALRHVIYLASSVIRRIQSTPRSTFSLQSYVAHEVPFLKTDDTILYASVYQLFITEYWQYRVS